MSAFDSVVESVKTFYSTVGTFGATFIILFCFCSVIGYWVRYNRAKTQMMMFKSFFNLPKDKWGK